MRSQNSFSQETIRRLSLYLRNLKKLKSQKVEVVSSDKIARFLRVTPVQFRKDLSYFGGFGKRGIGYEVSKLISEIESILGLNKPWKIALVGAGRLGSALLEFEGFSKFNIKITCAFDNHKTKVGKLIGGVKIAHVRDLKKTIRREGIRMAIIATPPDVAQGVAGDLTEAGIKGILNFAPLVLDLPSSVFISNVDMAIELESLIFFVKQKCR